MVATIKVPTLVVRDPIGREKMKGTTKASIMVVDIADVWCSAQYGCFLQFLDFVLPQYVAQMFSG